VAAALFAGCLIIGFESRRAIKHKQGSGGAEEQGSREEEKPPCTPAPLRPRIKSASVQKLRLVAAFAIIIVLGIMAITFDTSALGQRLVSLRNLYGRLATWEAAAGITLDRPFFGVGLTNYNDYFEKKYIDEDRPAEAVLDARAAPFPHSNFLWVAAELGLFAFALYVAANIYIFLMGYREFIKAKSAEGRAAAATTLAIAAVYSIPGLTLASGAYSDLNLYFFFMIGLLLNICQRSEGKR
jgi:O-antigen ligase